MIETAHGNFELIKDHREALDIKSFNDRYVDWFDRYLYVVGDISGEKLRLRGFTEKTIREVQDYLMESLPPNCPYFILKRLSPAEIKDDDET
ncbi:MAG: DUF1027 domain-containing protein [Acholeplasmatales bacterium]|nr:MAG: DUF1027 domain-containing protein [Acholeplasmatales bacterium]